MDLVLRSVRGQRLAQAILLLPLLQWWSSGWSQPVVRSSLRASRTRAVDRQIVRGFRSLSCEPGVVLQPADRARSDQWIKSVRLAASWIRGRSLSCSRPLPTADSFVRWSLGPSALARFVRRPAARVRKQWFVRFGVVGALACSFCRLIVAAISGSFFGVGILYRPSQAVESELSIVRVEQ